MIIRFAIQTHSLCKCDLPPQNSDLRMPKIKTTEEKKKANFTIVKVEARETDQEGKVAG